MKPLAFTAFAARVLRVNLTPAQSAFAKVAFDGIAPRDLEGEERELARRLFGDVDTVPSGASEVVDAVCGARGGKSYVFCALRLLHLALTVDLSTMAPGEIAAALIVAPDLRLARQTLRYAIGAAEGTPDIKRRIVSASSDGIVLRRENGRAVSLECLPATRGGSAVRGRSLVGAALDEAAFFRDSEYVVNDEEVFRAVAPRVLPGGQIIIASTPWAEGGLLYDLFNANHGSPTTALAAHAPTVLLRGDARTRGIVERERQRDPENARREFDAEFMPAGSGAFFDSRAIAASVDEALVLPIEAKVGTRVVVGCDFGFRSDSSALVVVHREGNVSAVAELLELRPSPGAPLAPSAVVAAFAEVARRHHATFVVSDAHYRESIIEHLVEHGLGFTDAPTGVTGKSSTYLRARALLHEGRVRLPNEPRLVRQLREVISRPTPGGGVTISSPRSKSGGHGDLVSALVLALHFAGESTVEPVGAKPGTLEWDRLQEEAAKERRRKDAERKADPRGWGAMSARSAARHINGRIY